MGSYLTRPSILSVVDAINEKETEFERRGNRHRDRGYVLHEVDELSESSFATMFRMNREGLEFIDSCESYSFYFGCLSVYYSWVMLGERRRGWGQLKLSWVQENTSWAPLCFRPLATLPRTDFHQLGLFSWLFPLNSIPYSAPTIWYRLRHSHSV